jgi:hypothetical protein
MILMNPKSSPSNFLYSYNRHNEVNLNLGLIKAIIRVKISCQPCFNGGTYAQDNMAAEQEALRYINEANIGIKISKTKNLWMDAGSCLPILVGKVP